MLAPSAQGFAEHLSHGVNARLFTPRELPPYPSSNEQIALADGREVYLRSLTVGHPTRPSYNITET